MDFTYLKNFMDDLAKERTPGNAVEIYVDGKKVFQYAAGCADLETRKPLTGEEHFFIYSASKLTTVTAALQLLEKGKILITDPLYDYIPEYRDMFIRTEQGEPVKAQNPITIGDLFTMTAGLDYNTDAPAFARARELTHGKMDTVTVIKCLASEPLSFEPGTHWQYSLCHDVLAGLVSVITGMKFRDYVKENIFDPLGMTHSAYHLTPEIEANLASQYSFVPTGESADFDIVEAQKYGRAKDGTFVNIGTDNFCMLGDEYDCGGGGIITTVSDYAMLMAALADRGRAANGERILSDGTVELMRTNRLGAALLKDYNWAQLTGYGYGLGVHTLLDKAASGSNGSLGEFGWGGAAGATAFSDPERRLGVFFAQHCINPREEYYQPRLRNVIYSCLDR